MQSPLADSGWLRRVGLAAAIAGVGLLGALPSGLTSAEGLLSTVRGTPQSLLAWLALCGFPLGLIAGRFDLRGLLPFVVLPWLVVLSWLARTSPAVPAPLFGWAAATGLFALGVGIGARFGGSIWRAAGLAALVLGLLAALPVAGGVLERPWPPSVGARLLDASPVALVEECAGVDWLLHGDNYAALGSDSIDPGLRQPWHGGRVAPLLLVLGALSVAISRLLDQRARQRSSAGLR